jgi:hypothetical protein
MKTAKSHMTSKSRYEETNDMDSFRGRRGRDRMVVGFTTTCVIGAYFH